MPDVAEAARAVRAGERTAVELTSQCLEAIEGHNEQLNAFVHLDPSGALAAAESVDAIVRSGDVTTLGPLAGVPFGVKDLEDCAGMPTTRGSRWFADGPAKESDSIHVARLRAAGAIPIGKTATPEFGAWAYTASPLLGVTRNPWDHSRTPGGSSGGSSAAVSAGLVPFCTASDGGGSIRTPASFTGLVGLRATYGRIPTLGDTHLSQNAVVGAVTTTVADTALLLDVMAGPDARDRTCLPPPAIGYLDSLWRVETDGLRVGWSRDLGFAAVDDEVATVARAGFEALVADCGARAAAPDVHFEDYTRIYALVEGVDRFVGVDETLWTTRLDELDPRSAPGWTSMARRTLPQAAAVEAARRALVARCAELFGEVDLLVTPTSSLAAFGAEGPMPTAVGGTETHMGMSVALTFLASLVNLPAISVPCGRTAAGLPVGLQVIGPRFREELVLAAAARLESQHPWPRHAVTRDDAQPAATGS
jgi:aspartyl-tRNA(Asn)/glutamyl-tRNA(Gln) amidotransferase subunit A